MSKQFDLTRGFFMSFVNGLEEKTIDIQPAGFNNTLRWHIGHVLVSAESLLFGFPEQSKNIPDSYHGMFRTGSKPSDWGNAEVPTVEDLINSLDKQTIRINELPDEFFAEKLSFQFPVGDIQTFGEMFEFMMYHEAEHLGVMKAIKRLI
jgi:DinB superfamily